jgi:DNA-directed RNA polymerase specialized sigma subunit
MYFTAAHEAAIVEYCSSSCNERKSELYVDFIQPTFDEMVDKIVYSYHFTSLANIDDLRAECKAWLISILDKFDPAKGSKAFSYFSVVTKNWFIHKVKKQTKRRKREIEYDLVAKEVYDQEVQREANYLTKREKEDFWLKLWEEIESWGTNDMRDNEKKVYDAIKILLSSADEIDLLNKKAVYLYLREITGLNTKQIVTQLNKMREKYRDFRMDWDNGKI